MALALLAATAAVAWRLALAFHLAWPPVLVLYRRNFAGSVSGIAGGSWCDPPARIHRGG